MGMLTEIHASDGSVYWIVSTFPDEMNDAKWMAVEAQYGEARTPEDLYNMIRATVPPHWRRLPAPSRPGRLLGSIVLGRGLQGC